MIVEDEECTMWTVGGFCNPRLDPLAVFEHTNVMAGPSHTAPNVSKMVRDLGLGDGQYAVFATPQEARSYMLASMSERFAFGVAYRDRVGHMVNAYRDGDQLSFLDFQPPPHDGQFVAPPEGEDCVYWIWPINDDE